MQKADVVVLVVGLASWVTQSEGHDRLSYTLPGKQQDLVELVAAQGKPVVVVLIAGCAVGIDFIAARKDWALLVPGVGGPFGGSAIARTLFGDAAPSGLLPYVYSCTTTWVPPACERTTLVFAST